MLINRFAMSPINPGARLRTSSDAAPCQECNQQTLLGALQESVRGTLRPLTPRGTADVVRKPTFAERRC
jgi:hypothetical protein